MFLRYYVAYTAYLVLAVTNVGVSRSLGGILLGFVVALTGITLLIGVARSLKRTR